jgi:hypothetical protein
MIRQSIESLAQENRIAKEPHPDTPSMTEEKLKNIVRSGKKKG